MGLELRGGIVVLLVVLGCVLCWSPRHPAARGQLLVPMWG